jgi:class 3 adenylate cyclase/DNA-binding response OmpR family regulator
MIEPQGKGTILIVDDIPVNLEVLLNVLNAHGFEVLVAVDGESAIEQIAYAQPDIILLDVMMPGIDGFETCRRLKADETTSHIPVIFMTALTDTVDKVTGFEIGAVDYITKPLQHKEVVARVNTHMTICQLQRQLRQTNQALEQRVEQRTLELAAEVQERKRAEETLRNIVEGTASVTGTNFFRSLVRYLSSTLRVDAVFVTEMLEVEQKRVRTLVFWKGADFADPMEYSAIGTPCEMVLNGEVVVLAQGIQERFPNEPSNDAYIGVPLHDSDGAILGHLVVMHPHPIGNCARDLPILKIFAARAGAELERKRAERDREQAYAHMVELNLAYSRFVPTEFLLLLQHESIMDVRLGDHVQMEMTLLFADIRSFTTLSETMTPEQNFNFINSYLSRVSPIIRQYHGFIDKYMGDGIMAIFPRVADDALQAAIAIQREVKAYNDHRAQQGFVPIQVGIGIHTGNLMLGTIGEEERMEGTVISDAVNLAARLEGLSKRYQTSIIVSIETLNRLEHFDEYDFRFLGIVQVKGKGHPVSVFELLNGNPESVSELLLKTQATFEEGLSLYYNKRFAESTVKFSLVLEENAEDRAARLYLERAAQLMVQGAPSDWHGIETLDEK